MAKDRHNHTFTWWDWGKPTTTRVSTVSVPADIRTGVLLHINLERHQFTNLHGNAYNNMFSILDMDSEIESCQEYKYLGVIFDTRGTRGRRPLAC